MNKWKNDWIFNFYTMIFIIDDINNNFYDIKTNIKKIEWDIHKYAHMQFTIYGIIALNLSIIVQLNEYLWYKEWWFSFSYVVAKQTFIVVQLYK